MSPTTLVVVPTLNEAGCLPPMLARLLALEPAVDILVVDDDSPDGTADIAECFARDADGRMRVLRRTGPRGLGPAYIEGFRLGLTGPYRSFVQMDADFSHDPDVVPVLVAMLEGADLVLGSRYVLGGGTAGWGRFRRFVSLFGSLYSGLSLSLAHRDLTGGYKAWRRECLASIGLDKVRSNGYCFQVETTYRAVRRGARVVELPILFTDRRVGQSKMSREIFLEAVWRVPLLRFAVMS